MSTRPIWICFHTSSAWGSQPSNTMFGLKRSSVVHMIGINNNSCCTETRDSWCSTSALNQHYELQLTWKGVTGLTDTLLQCKKKTQQRPHAWIILNFTSLICCSATVAGWQLSKMNKTYFELAELKSPRVSYACPRQSRTHYILVLHWYLWCTYQCTQHSHQSRWPSIHRNCALSTFTQSFQRRARYHEQRSDVSPRSGWPKTTSSSTWMVRPGQWLHNVKQAEFKHNPTRWSMYVTLSPVSNKITNINKPSVTKTPSKTSWPVKFANFPGPASAALQRCGHSCARGARVAVSLGSVHGRATWQQHHLGRGKGHKKQKKQLDHLGLVWFITVYLPSFGSFGWFSVHLSKTRKMSVNPMFSCRCSYATLIVRSIFMLFFVVRLWSEPGYRDNMIKEIGRQKWNWRYSTGCKCVYTYVKRDGMCVYIYIYIYHIIYILS